MMKMYKNNKEVHYIELTQFSVDTEVLKFKFKKDFCHKNVEDFEVQIMYDTDKLSSNKNANISVKDIGNEFYIIWVINNTINHTAGIKKCQIVLKNDKKRLMSKVFQIAVKESLEIDKEIVETSISYLEYWEERMKALENGCIWVAKEW